MSIIIQATEDGSDTCFNERYNQAYHSKHGAYREALEKHVQACKIQDLAKTQSKIKILDICFGLGYNSFTAIDSALKVSPHLEIEIIGLENDLEILSVISKIKYPEAIEPLGHLVTRSLENKSQATKRPRDQVTVNISNLIECVILLGDARESIKTLEPNSFDAIFFDPFSPSVCPELWTEEFISDTVRLAKPGAYISTYSCARVVKDNFAKAGCEILEGPKAGRRNGGVLGRKSLGH